MTLNPELLNVIASIRNARFIHGLTCVHCAARCVQRWGTFAGRQRYRCGSCLRTFSDLTGTPVTYLKKRDRRRLTYQERGGWRRLSWRTFEAASVMLNPGTTCVAASGPLSPIATAVRRRQLRGHDLYFRRALHPRRPNAILHHTRSITDFIQREKRWLKRFRGVSQRWVHLYLSWFEMVDPATRAPTFAELLMWPVFLE